MNDRQAIPDGWYAPTHSRRVTHRYWYSHQQRAVHDIAIRFSASSLCATHRRVIRSVEKNVRHGRSSLCVDYRHRYGVDRNHKRGEPQTIPYHPAADALPIENVAWFPSLVLEKIAKSHRIRRIIRQWTAFVPRMSRTKRVDSVFRHGDAHRCSARHHDHPFGEFPKRIVPLAVSRR